LRDGNPNVVNNIWLNHSFEDKVSNDGEDYLRIEELIQYIYRLIESSIEKELFVSSIYDQMVIDYKEFFDKHSNKKKRGLVINAIKSGMKKEIFRFNDKLFDNSLNIILGDVISIKNRPNIYCKIFFNV
jgi:hypothetical protein